MEACPRPKAQPHRLDSKAELEKKNALVGLIPRATRIFLSSSPPLETPTLTLRVSKVLLASIPLRRSRRLTENRASPPPPPSPHAAMVVSYTQEHVYRHPWHRVTAAAWRKFTDPAARAADSGALSHILDVHTLSRDVDAVSGRLRAVRAIAGRTPPLPLLLRGLVAGGAAGGGDVVVLCVERTDVDAPARDMRVASRNATLRGLVDVQERCSYEPHPARPDEWTLFRQETTIRCAPLAAVAAKLAELVERRCAERFTQNADRGKEVVERICQDLAVEEDSYTHSTEVLAER